MATGWAISLSRKEVRIQGGVRGEGAHAPPGSSSSSGMVPAQVDYTEL